MKILLHIGTAKTGSTALQRTLAANRDALAQAGVLFPDSLVGYGFGHIGLYWLTLRPDELDRTRFVAGHLDHRQFAERQMRLRDSLAREIDAARPDVLILSSEHLSVLMKTPEQVAAVRSLVNAFGTEVEVHLCLREQADLLGSLYAEMIKAGYRGRFRFTPPPAGETHWDAALKRERGAQRRDPQLLSYMDLSECWLDYESLTKRWAREFGDDAMKLSIYASPGASGNGYMNRLLLGAGANLRLATPTDVSNQSDSALTTEMRRWINMALRRDVTHRLERFRWKAVMHPKLARSGRPFRLSEKDRQLVRDVFAAGNASVADAYFPDRGALFGHETHPNG